MNCTLCGKNIRLCECPGVTERLRYLVGASHVYVGNIIEDRIAAGRSAPEDFAGLNIHSPFANRDAMLAAKTGTVRTVREESEAHP